MVRNIYCVWFSQSSLNSLASVSVTCRRCTLALSLFVRRMERSRRRSHQNAERTVCSSALWLQRNRLGARVCFSLLLFAACSSNVEWPTFRSIVRTQRRRNGTFRAPTRTQPTVASHMPIVQFRIRVATVRRTGTNEACVCTAACVCVCLCASHGQRRTDECGERTLTQPPPPQSAIQFYTWYMRDLPFLLLFSREISF